MTTKTDITLPPLPVGITEHGIVGHDGSVYADVEMECYARAAVEADRARRTEPRYSDDLAVDSFACAMKEKLGQARAKGRSGWQGCDPIDLSRMLREHVEKGDPRDVANFCMFLWNLGKPISAAPVAQAPVAYLDLDTGGYMDLGTDLTDEQLAALPKGRNMLAIIGTYGMDGYVSTPVAAQPAASAEPKPNEDAIYLGCARMGLAEASDEEVLNYVRIAERRAHTPVAAQLTETQVHRDSLMRAIAEAAIRLGIAHPGLGQVSGPQCLQLLHDIEEQAAKVLDCISAVEERDHLRELVAAQPSVPDGWRKAVKAAYGFLWMVNNEPGTPIQYAPEKAAYEARKLLRDLLTHDERGNGINAAMLSAAPTPPADAQAQPDTSDYVSCGCGDMYPPDSYDAGYIHGAGQCENCEAGQPHIEAIRDAALEEAALFAETYLNPYGHDAASAHACDMTAVAVGKRIRALKSRPAQQDAARAAKG